jgi:hypothetical protein
VFSFALIKTCYSMFLDFFRSIHFSPKAHLVSLTFHSGSLLSSCLSQDFSKQKSFRKLKNLRIIWGATIKAGCAINLQSLWLHRRLQDRRVASMTFDPLIGGEEICSYVTSDQQRRSWPVTCKWQAYYFLICNFLKRSLKHKRNWKWVFWGANNYTIKLHN